MEIEFNGNVKTVDAVCEGVVKYKKAYYIMDHSCGEWKYCSQDRLDKLAEKHGSVEKVGTDYRKGKTPKPSKQKQKQTTTKAVRKNDGAKKLPVDKLSTTTDIDRLNYYVDPELREADYTGFP